MRRMGIVALVLVLAVVPVQAEQHDGHTVHMPDPLKWVEPPVLPGANSR